MDSRQIEFEVTESASKRLHELDEGADFVPGILLGRDNRLTVGYYERKRVREGRIVGSLVSNGILELVVVQPLVDVMLEGGTLDWVEGQFLIRNKT